MPLRLALSGGHLTPALALIQECRLHQDQVMVIGAKASQTRELEQAEIAKTGYSYHTLPVFKYDRFHPLTLLIRVPNALKAIVTAFKLLSAFKPHAVVVFGGFVSVPLAIAAKLLRLPLFLHEQTMSPGLATKLISPWCTLVFTAYPHNKGKATVVGNLLRPEMYTHEPVPAWFTPAMAEKPLLYITGGNQGSRAINHVIASLYHKWAQHYVIVHQFGHNSENRNESLINQTLTALPPKVKARICVRPWFDASMVSWIMDHAHMVIGRSGANTVSELMVKGVPAILIPLPKSAGNEQQLQADYLKDHHAALVLSQTELSQATLEATVDSMESHYQSFYKHAQQLKTMHTLESVKTVYRLIAAHVSG